MFTGETNPGLFFPPESEGHVRNGNFCLLGLFSGFSFVLTQVDNRVLTADDRLQLILLCSGSNSFFLDPAHFLVDLCHCWELLREEIISFFNEKFTHKS